MNTLDECLKGPTKRAWLQAVVSFARFGPSEHPGRVIHVPDPDGGVLKREPHAPLPPFAPPQWACRRSVTSLPNRKHQALAADIDVRARELDETHWIRSVWLSRRPACGPRSPATASL